MRFSFSFHSGQYQKIPQFRNRGYIDIFGWKTLPEEQRTQDIESKTWIFSAAKTNTNSNFIPFSLPPLLDDHLSHLVHVPVILLAATISMTTVTSKCSNNIYCHQHDHSSPAHQLQYSVQLLYHHLAAPLGDLQTHIGLDHHLNDNHQPQITLLASSASIELVSSSARVTSAKFHKVLYVVRDTGTHRPDPRDTWVR